MSCKRDTGHEESPRFAGVQDLSHPPQARPRGSMIRAATLAPEVTCILLRGYENQREKNHLSFRSFVRRQIPAPLALKVSEREQNDRRAKRANKGLQRVLNLHRTIQRTFLRRLKEYLFALKSGSLLTTHLLKKTRHEQLVEATVYIGKS